MRINNNNQNNVSMKGFLNNKYLLKGLEKISEHGATFTAVTSFALSVAGRPLAIAMTPKVEKENKQYAIGSSLSSAVIKLGIVEAIALPVENFVKKIDENPLKYLTAESIKKYSPKSGSLKNSASYRLATQLLKLGTGFVSAIPKSMLTIALLPIVMDKMFNLKPMPKEEEVVEPLKDLNFTAKGDGMFGALVKKILNNNKFQDFVLKNSGQEKNIAFHMSAATDSLLTATYAYTTAKSQKIKENRKDTLIYNNAIATFITIAGGYLFNSLISNKTDRFLQKFSEINKGNPKLPKYIEGLNIVRPAIIFATIYYGLLPMLSLYYAERLDKFVSKECK